MNELGVTSLPIITDEAIHRANLQKLDIPLGAEKMYEYDVFRQMERGGNLYLASRLPRTVWDISARTQVPCNYLTETALDVYNWLSIQLGIDSEETHPRRNTPPHLQPTLPNVLPQVYDGVVMANANNPQFAAETLEILDQDGNEHLGRMIGGYAILGKVGMSNESYAYTSVSLIVYRALHNQAEINMLEQSSALTQLEQ